MIATNEYMMNQRRGLKTPKIRSQTSFSTSDNESLSKKALSKEDTESASSRILSEETFQKWQRFIEDQVGFVLPKNQTHWLWHAVNRLAIQEETTQADLFDRVVNDDFLKQKIIDAVLIPQSRFFRHYPSLEFIKAQAKIISRKNNQATHAYQALLEPISDTDVSLESFGEASPTNSAAPNLSDSKPSEYSINVWSVGCSYGQEAWSVAMVLGDLYIPYRVWGADVNESALEHAERGYYDIKQLEEIPFSYKKFVDIHDKHWSIAQTLRRNTEFLKYNVFATNMPDLPLMDIIICQNVLIYFRQFDQRDILSRLVSRLQVGGYLILAPGEASQWRHACMQKQHNLQVNVWQRTK